MALNDANIFRYNFNSESNPKWNFQLQFLRGSDIQVGNYDSSYIPDYLFAEDIDITVDFKDNLPIGIQKQGVLELTLFKNLAVGDYIDFVNWCVDGGQVISSQFYPNQWRILSNNGRGSSDVTYDIIEFWGVQDLTTEQEIEFEFGNNFQIPLKILSVQHYLLNEVISYAGFTGNTYTRPVVYNTYKGLNLGIDTSICSFSNYDNEVLKDVKVASSTQLMTNFADELQQVVVNKLRYWLILDTASSNQGVIGFDNTFITHWNFFKQLYDLTTQVGLGLGSNADVKFITEILDGVNILGGLLSSKSTDGFTQYNTLTDLLEQIYEQFICKLTFSFIVSNVASSERLILQSNPIFDSYNGGSITLTSDDILGVAKAKLNSFNVSQSSVNYKAYSSNQNKVVLKKYGNLRKDTFDNKSIFNNYIQVADLNKMYSAYAFNVPPIQITQLYYLDNCNFTPFYANNNTANCIIKIHENCSVDLGSSDTISNDSITGQSILPLAYGNDYLQSETAKNENRAILIEFVNQRNAVSGLSYVQAKAYNEICNSKAMTLTFENFNNLVMPREIGQMINCDLNTLLNLNSYFSYTNHIVTAVKTNLRTSKSEITIFVRG
jgi:hypothetical protein